MVRYEYQYFLHVTDMWSYRARIKAGHDYDAINAMSKRASARYSACHAEIGKTMQRGWTDNGACTFSDSVSEVMDRENQSSRGRHETHRSGSASGASLVVAISNCPFLRQTALSIRYGRLSPPAERDIVELLTPQEQQRF